MMAHKDGKKEHSDLPCCIVNLCGLRNEVETRRTVRVRGMVKNSPPCIMKAYVSGSGIPYLDAIRDLVHLTYLIWPAGY